MDHSSFWLLFLFSQKQRSTQLWAIMITIQRVSYHPHKTTFMSKYKSYGKTGWIQHREILLKEVKQNSSLADWAEENKEASPNTHLTMDLI